MNNKQFERLVTLLSLLVIGVSSISIALLGLVLVVGSK